MSLWEKQQFILRDNERVLRQLMQAGYKPNMHVSEVLEILAAQREQDELTECGFEEANFPKESE